MERADYPRATVILRNVPRALADTVIGTIADDQLPLAVEITRNSVNFDDISRYVQEHPDTAVGAGTILTWDDAASAIAAGCKFVLSPVVLPAQIVDLCHAASTLVVSGAFTPTEISTALREGADIVKLFPISEVSAHYVRDVKAPLGDIPIMGVGGVTMSNLSQLFASGIDYVGIGSGLFGRELGSVTDAQVRDVLHRLVAVVAEAHPTAHVSEG